jgi:transcriptional regulator with XRE-family HTH domain
MEFLGTVDLNTAKVHGSGACWKLRSLWCRLAGNLSRDDANFSAARALLGLEVRKVAQKAYLTPRQVTNLERGRSFTRKGYDSLREFFEESGVEFLSFRTSPLDYAGLGVRVGFSDALLPSGLWANRRATWRRADSAADSHVLE